MSERETTGTNGQKPYKGPDSYQVEDAAFFFGRDRDAEQLIAKIRSRRFTLLHAPSGAGKTSLLNARIIPGLERRGSLPIRILPQDHPTASVRVTTLQYLIPPLEAEHRAIERARKALATSEPLETLGELRARYQALPEADTRKRDLIVPLALKRVHHPVIFPEETKVTPFFCRLLRSSIKLRVFEEHLGVLVARTDLLPSSGFQLTNATPLDDLLDLLAEPALEKAYRDTLSLLDVPVFGLWPFFENLAETYGQTHRKFSLVLILDQFEELYTRFVDLGLSGGHRKAGLPDWRLRDELIEEIRTLYTHSYASDASEEEASTGETFLPIRFVISMRDEYIAQLDPIRRFVGNFDASAYHLEWLDKQDARAAIEKPARQYGYAYTRETYEEIIDKLAKEDRFVQPSYLQIVCEKLWNEEGHDLSRQAGQQQGASEAVIEKGMLDRLDGVEGILRSFFDDFLMVQLTTRPERLEALELLEPLITAQGTRNIVEQSQLINQPFRDVEKREALLQALVDARIVRTENRLGGLFAEITHEFLIEPILEAIRTKLTRDATYGQFREALVELATFKTKNYRGDVAHLLPKDLFTVLHDYFDRVEWPAWSIDLLFRSAVMHAQDKETLLFWAEQYQQSGSPATMAAIREAFASEGGRRRILSLEDVRVLNRERASDAEGAALDFSREQVETILHSHLYNAGDAEREDVTYWTKVLINQAPEA